MLTQTPPVWHASDVSLLIVRFHRRKSTLLIESLDAEQLSSIENVVERHWALKRITLARF